MYEKAIFEHFSFLCIIKNTNAYDKDYISIDWNGCDGYFSIMSAFMEKPEYSYEGDACI